MADRATSRFLYKVRPGSHTSVAFGKLRDDQQEDAEMEARIFDRRTKIVRIARDGSDTDVLTAENNQFIGPMAGIVVGVDGSIAIGGPIPPTVAQAFGL